MQPEALTIPGIAGAVSVQTNWFTGRNTVTVGGQPVASSGRGRFLLPTTGGQPTEARVRAQVLDPFATVEVGGERYRTGPEVPMAMRILGLLPFLLIAVGGLLGGVIGALGVVANFWIIKRVESTALKVLAMIGVLGAAFVVWLIAAVAVSYALT